MLVYFIFIRFFFTYLSHFWRQQASKSLHPSALQIGNPLNVVVSSPYNQSKVGSGLANGLGVRVPPIWDKEASTCSTRAL